MVLIAPPKAPLWACLHHDFQNFVGPSCTISPQRCLTLFEVLCQKATETFPFCQNRLAHCGPLDGPPVDVYSFVKAICLYLHRFHWSVGRPRSCLGPICCVSLGRTRCNCLMGNRRSPSRHRGGTCSGKIRCVYKQLPDGVVMRSPSSSSSIPLHAMVWWCQWALRPVHPRGGGVSSVRVRDSPPPLPLPALRAHLVTKGQWLLAIHMVAPKAPENFVPFAGDP